MLENLTAKDFLGSLQLNMVATLYIDSLLQENVIAYNATFNELMDRNMQFKISTYLEKAFKDGLVIKNRTAITQALFSSLRSDRRVLSFCSPMVNYIEDHCGPDQVFDLEKFNEVMRDHVSRGFDRYLVAMTPDVLAHTKPVTWTQIVLHYVEEEKTTRGTFAEEQEATEKAHEKMRTILQKAIRDIAYDDTLLTIIPYPIRSALKIDDYLMLGWKENFDPKML